MTRSAVGPGMILVLMTSVVLLSCGSSGTTAPLAAPGISSVVITPITGMQSGRAQAVAIQTDHKIVAAGTAYNGTRNLFALTRYNEVDGSLDTNFNGAGMVTTAIGSVDDQAQALAIQSSDQKLVVAGFSYDTVKNHYLFALARYNTDGSLDTAGFGSGAGFVTTEIGLLDDRAFAVGIQSDGKIVAAGYSSVTTSTGAQGRVALVRYNTDGTLDTSFNGTGLVTTTIVVPPPPPPFPSIPPTSAAAFALAIQDGRLVVAGVADQVPATTGSKTTLQDQFLVVCYKILTGDNTDGQPDASFNHTGIVMTAIGTVRDQAHAVVIQPDGKVVVAGASSATQTTVALVRYNADGSLDTSFGTMGKTTTAILSGAVAFALAVQADGKLVAAGTAYNNTYGEFALVRYDAKTGDLDGKFGSAGKVNTAITYGAEAFGLAIQPDDGKLVAAGFSHGFDAQTQAQLPDQFTLARYETTGKLDAAFVTP